MEDQNLTPILHATGWVVWEASPQKELSDLPETQGGSISGAQWSRIGPLS